MTRKWTNIDWFLVASVTPLLLAGLLSMKSLGGAASDYYFNRQIIWIAVGFMVFFVFSFIDWYFLKNSGVLLLLFAASSILLIFLLIFGAQVRGATSWLRFGLLSFEPAEPIKLFLILILSKYFSRRHVDISHIKHILVSGFYAAVPALLIFFQPDFGSAIVVFAIWLGMVVVSGINKKHFLLVLLVAVLVFSVSWLFVLKPYQKTRITTFLNPLEDPQGAGYNALQSVIAIGSGGFWGKGMGYGTQSRLEFLPEHQTDFIFAAFAEEWGFVGVIMLFSCFGFLLWRILKNALWGQDNFERFFGLGLSIYLMSHFILHVGMNAGVLPITGLNMPFLSYGGSHLVTIFAGLGILMGMRRHSSKTQQDAVVEFLGA